MKYGFKKMAVGILAVCLIASAAMTSPLANTAFNLSASAAAETVSNSSQVHYTLDKNGCLTISGSGAISESAFDSAAHPDLASQITKVKIEEGITEIGKYAFYGCDKLKSVTFADSVSSIGDAAFYKCSSLTDIQFPQSVKTIGKNAFHLCSSLKMLIIPKTISTIRSNAFGNCSALQCVIVFGKPSLAPDVFRYDSSLMNIFTPPKQDAAIRSQLGEKADVVKAMAFCGDTAYYGQDAAGTVHIFGTGAVNADIFHDSSDSESPILKVKTYKGITQINRDAFSFCRNLEHVEFADVRTIGIHAFATCDTLKTVTATNLRSILDGAFWKCTALHSVTLKGTKPEGLSYLEENGNVTVYYPMLQWGLMNNTNKTTFVQYDVARLDESDFDENGVMLSASKIGADTKEVVLPSNAHFIPEGMLPEDITAYLRAQKPLHISGAYYEEKRSDIGYVYTITVGESAITITEENPKESVENVKSDDALNSVEKFADREYCHSVSLAKDLSVTYSISTEGIDDPENLYLEVRNERTGNIQKLNGTADAENKTVQFCYRGIPANHANDKLNAALVYRDNDGTEFRWKSDSYSVTDDCYAVLANPNADDKLRELMRSLLNLCAAVQKYANPDIAVSDLINAGVSDAEKSAAENEFLVLRDAAETRTLENATAKIVGKSLLIGNHISLKYYMDLSGVAAKENVKMRISHVGADGKMVEEEFAFSDFRKGTADYANDYTLVYGGLSAAELDTILTAVILENDTEISDTVVYSVESYAAQAVKKVPEKENMIHLVRTVIQYANAAKAYMK